MRKLFLAAAIAAALASPAAAQSGCSSIATGAVLTAAQWNACFAAKQNTLGFTPVNKAGDTMLGRLTTTPSTTLVSGFNVAPGTAPTSPNNGDVWTTTAGLFVRINGVTVGPLTGPVAGSFAGTSPITVSFPAGVVTYGFDFSVANTFTARQAINLNSASLPSPITGAVLNLGAANATVARVQLNSFGDIVAYTGAVYGGTAASPTAVTSGTQLTGVNAYAYNGAALVGPLVSFRTYAAQNIAVGAQGTKACIATTANSTTTLLDSLCQENNGAITISPSTSTLPAALTGTLLRAVSQTGTYITAESFGADTGFFGRSANGTIASPTATASGNTLSVFGGVGRGTTGFATGARGFIAITASQAWTDTNQGTQVDLYSTANNTASSSLRVRVEQDGGVTIPNTVTGGSKGVSTINSTGLHYVAGNAVASSATSPIVLNATTGVLTCPTCATSSGGGAITGTSPISVSGAGVVSINTNGIDNTLIRQSGGLSVIGRSASTTGNVADITGTANQVLRVDSGGTTLGFGAINVASTAAVTGQLNAASFPILTGDVVTAGGSLATSITNLPTGVTMAGSLLATNIAAPSTPASGKTSLYVDSSGKVLSAKADTGTVSVTVIPNAGGSNLFVTAIGSGGVVSTAQPAFTNLSGSLACSQTPALTGNVTTSAGSCATTIAASVVTTAMMANGAAWSLFGNFTGSSAAPQYSTITGLTLKASPAAADEVIISDSAASNALKKTTVSALASAGSVASIAGNTGAFTLSNGITNSTNDIRLATISANSLLANNTGSTAIPSGVAYTALPFARVLKVQVFTANGTYTPSTGMQYVKLTCVGGGGSGAGAVGAAANLTAGGAGGSGGYSFAIKSAADIGASKAVVVGAGGTAPAAGANNGTAGADSCFTTSTCVSGQLVSGKGGSGGQFTQLGVQNGAGGLGGIAGTGDFSSTGTPGGMGTIATISSINFQGANGGSSFFGGGGLGSATGSNGSAATNYGGGGGAGVQSNTASNVAGGNGSGGVCLAEEVTNQ